jgi:hypothetical protein
LKKPEFIAHRLEVSRFVCHPVIAGPASRIRCMHIVLLYLLHLIGFTVNIVTTQFQRRQIDDLLGFRYDPILMSLSSSSAAAGPSTPVSRTAGTRREGSGTNVNPGRQLGTLVVVVLKAVRH